MEGASITNWDIAQADMSDVPEDVSLSENLRRKVLLIADRPQSGENATYENLKKNLGDQFIGLGDFSDTYEIENTLSSLSVMAGMRVFPKKFAEAEQGGVIEKIKWEDYRSVPLGKYLDDIKPESTTFSFGAPSGTLDQKVKFCKEGAVPSITSAKDMTPVAIEVTEKIISHIEEMNK